MRNAVPVILILVMAAFTAFVVSMGTTGAELRKKEQRAARVVEQMMLAQEAWRAQRSDDSVPAFAPAAELLSEIDAELELVDDTDSSAILCTNEYVFQWKLLSGDDPSLPKNAQRYEIWAWPLDPEDRRLVLFYASNAGYLIQGENGEAAGLSERPPDAQPLRELGQDASLVSRRWTILWELPTETAALTQ